MRIRPTIAVMLGLGLALAACGGSSPSASQSVRPVTVTVTTPAPDTSPAPSAPTQTAIQPTTTATAPSTQTRTQSAPASATPSGGTPAGGDPVQSAATRLRGLGFTPLSTSTFDTDQTLHVLVGARTGNAHAQQAFFFDDATYLGTDAAATSGTIAVTAHSDTDVTLRYGIYRSTDQDCCPSGTPVSVRFELDGGRLMALDPIPGAAARR